VMGRPLTELAPLRASLTINTPIAGLDADLLEQVLKLRIAITFHFGPAAVPPDISGDEPNQIEPRLARRGYTHPGYAEINPHASPAWPPIMTFATRTNQPRNGLAGEPVHQHATGEKVSKLLLHEHR